MSYKFVFFLLALAGPQGRHANRFYHKAPKMVGDICTWERFNQATCQLAENCPSLKRLVEGGEINIRDVPSCGFIDNHGEEEELFCCPIENKTIDVPATKAPVAPPIHLPPPPSKPADNTKTLHLGSLGYYSSDLMYNEYRCTVVLLSPGHVLGTNLCISSNNNIRSNPHVVLLNTSDDKNEELELEIKRKQIVMNDVVLFEFNHPLSQKEFEKNGYRDPVCRSEDVTVDTKLVAIGHAQDSTGNNCELFEQEVHLEQNSKCRKVQNQREVKGLGASHFCVRVGAVVSQVPNHEDQCQKCLTASTSVLHIKKPNGIYCVAGIATPTTNSCDEGVEHLYYTNILGDAISDFLNLNLKRPSYRQRS